MLCCCCCCCISRSLGNHDVVVLVAMADGAVQTMTKHNNNPADKIVMIENKRANNNRKKERTVNKPLQQSSRVFFFYLERELSIRVDIKPRQETVRKRKRWSMIHLASIFLFRLFFRHTVPCCFLSQRELMTSRIWLVIRSSRVWAWAKISMRAKTRDRSLTFIRLLLATKNLSSLFINRD